MLVRKRKINRERRNREVFFLILCLLSTFLTLQIHCLKDKICHKAKYQKDYTFSKERLNSNSSKRQHFGNVSSKLEPDPEVTIFLNVTLDGHLQLLSLATQKVLWTNSSAIAQPLLLINSMQTSSASKILSRNLTDQRGAIHQEVLGYTFYYIFQPIGKGHIFVAKEGKPLEKLPFSLAEMVFKSPFAICQDHLLFGTKKSRYIALSIFDGSVITWIDGKECIEAIKITQSHIWIAVNQYSAVVYLHRDDSIVPVWNVDYIEVLEPAFVFPLQFPPLPDFPRVSYYTDGNMVIQMAHDYASSSSFAFKFSSPCYKTFQVVAFQGKMSFIREFPPSRVQETFNSIHLITIPDSDALFSLPSTYYIQIAGELVEKSPFDETSQESFSLIPYQKGLLSNTLTYYEPLAIGNGEIKPKKPFFMHYASIFISILLLFAGGIVVANKFHEPLNSLQVSDEILGYGSNGTVVFKGTFNGKIVAVKRILNEYVEVAEREVDLLHQTDPHPNVIRYYYMERKASFTYIVLEYCQCTLYDLYFNESFRELASELPLNRLIHELLDGICHLHKLNIIHRDIKPQNILITANKRLVISDFGLCKKLANIQQSFLPTTTFNIHNSHSGAGTVGWRPAECILLDEIQRNSPSNTPSSASSSIKIDRSIDVFTAGCIIYFILSQGNHPFGEPLAREANILANNYSLSGIDDVEYQDLLQRMICKNPQQRITIEESCKHLVFWSASKRLSFIQDISDRLEIHNPKYSELFKQVEMQFINILPSSKRRDWSVQFDNQVLTELFAFRTYNCTSFKDLLRFIRNKKNHFHQMDEQFQKIYGEIPDAFLNFFTSRFPKLLVCLYVAINNAKKCLDSTFRENYLG